MRTSPIPLLPTQTHVITRSSRVRPTADALIQPKRVSNDAAAADPSHRFVQSDSVGVDSP